MTQIGLLQEDFPAKTSALQGRAQESPERGLVFGLNIGGLLTIYDRTSQSWKMSGCLFTGDYAKYLEVLPKSGIMLNGKIYEQAIWVRRIKENESGLLPTPMKFDGKRFIKITLKDSIKRIESHHPFCWGHYMMRKLDIDKGSMNPLFAENMMGYPPKWTDSEDSEMRLSLK